MVERNSFERPRTDVITATDSDVDTATRAFHEAVQKGDQLAIAAARDGLVKVSAKRRLTQQHEAAEAAASSGDASTHLDVLQQLQVEHPELTDPYAAIEAE